MNVIVTGTKGKLITYFRNYVNEKKPDWDFKFVSLRNDDWKNLVFSKYDSIIHCAGITFAPKNDYETFRKINVEITKELFEEIVRQKTSHFIYLSSMAVYDGVGWGFGKEGLITSETRPKQRSNYGRSKFEAEEVIRKMGGAGTKISFVRAPAIVGEGLEEYFDRYIKFSKIPCIPIPMLHIEAKRSFVYIDTLIEYLCGIIANQAEGIFYPQNFPLLSVSEMISIVCKARAVRKKIWHNAGSFFPAFLQKRFFSQICYDELLSLRNNIEGEYITSEEAIYRTVKER